MINPITFDTYEKIYDDVLYFGINTVLRFNVTLGRKSDDNRKISYHNEFMYQSNKYIDKNNLISLKRVMDYFFTIENMKSTESYEKESIMIKIHDVLLLRDKLRCLTDWLIGDFSNKIFAMNKGKLIKISDVEPVIVSGFTFGKYLKFEPVIIDINDIRVEGIRMYLNSEHNYVDMTVDRFMGFRYLLESTDMYGAACSILAYMGRPEFGTNLTEFESNRNQYNNSSISEQERTTANTKRKTPVLGARQRSFFDKIND